MNDSPEHHVEWMKIFGNRRRLEVAIMSRFLSWSIKHFDFFAPTILEYAPFLRVVELMNVTMYDSGSHNSVTQLNAKVFSTCYHLIILRIFRAPIIFHEDEVEPPTELVNLHELPQSLEEVTVDGLPVAATDILRTIQKLKYLKLFHYFQSQVPKRNMLTTNGINWEILQAIVKHPKLNNVKVHVSSQVNSHSIYEEDLMRSAYDHGWNISGIIPGYMNMYQITLTK